MKTLSEQEKALAAAREEVINKCGYFEKLLLANKKKGFFTGDKVTLIKKSVSLMVVEILLIAMLFVRYFGMLKKGYNDRVVACVSPWWYFNSIYLRCWRFCSRGVKRLGGEATSGEAARKTRSSRGFAAKTFDPREQNRQLRRLIELKYHHGEIIAECPSEHWALIL